MSDTSQLDSKVCHILNKNVRNLQEYKVVNEIDFGGDDKTDNQTLTAVSMIIDNKKIFYVT